MILITGAAGKTGRAILAELVKKNEKVRVLVRRPEQASDLLAAGAAEALIGDLTQADTLQNAFSGISSIYHICPNMHPGEVEIGRLAITAAKRAGVRQFVYHSVLHPQTEKMPHHWNKLRVEELLLESGLNFTIFQPAPYMQNILAGKEAILGEGVYRVPYPADTAISLIDLQDLGEAAAAVLTGAGHENAIYELAGTKALTQSQVSESLAAGTGRAVRYEEIYLDQWRTAAKQSGLADYSIETLVRMFQYYAAYGLKGNNSVLKWLLGREPNSLDLFVKRDLIS